MAIEKKEGRGSGPERARVPQTKLANMKTEAEEASWFDNNQVQLLKLFETAAKEGSLRVGGKSVGITLSKDTETLRKPPSQKVMLRISAEDVARARRQAERQGIGYQTYIKMILHDGLNRRENVRQ